MINMKDEKVTKIAYAEFHYANSVLKSLDQFTPEITRRVVGRTEKEKCRGKEPWLNWSRIDLGVFFSGPKLNNRLADRIHFSSIGEYRICFNLTRNKKTKWDRMVKQRWEFNYLETICSRLNFLDPLWQLCYCAVVLLRLECLDWRPIHRFVVLWVLFISNLPIILIVFNYISIVIYISFFYLYFIIILVQFSLLPFIWFLQVLQGNGYWSRDAMERNPKMS